MKLVTINRELFRSYDSNKTYPMVDEFHNIIEMSGDEIMRHNKIVVDEIKDSLYNSLHRQTNRR